MTSPVADARDPRRLLLSIHDVSPRHDAAVARLFDHLGGADTPLALLVVPDFWHDAPIVSGSPFARRLRDWAAAGHEIFLHGFYHRDDSRHQSRAAQFKARHMTAGEGEFLGLDADEADRRIAEGRRIVEDAAGTAITGFIAPAWLYGPGAHAALKDRAIRIAEDHWRVWDPVSDATLARSPVITWATRTRMRTASSLAVGLLARTLPAPRIMRVGVHPGDVTKASVMRSIDATVRALKRTHRPSSYAALRGDFPSVS